MVIFSSVTSIPSSRSALRPWASIRPEVRLAIGVAVTMRVALSATAAWLVSPRPPYETAIIRAQYLGQKPLHDLLLSPWQRFDVLWYVRIALNGYGIHDGSTVYFPLYPLLIRLTAGVLGGNAVLAALTVSNLCFAGFLVVLYRLAAERLGDRVARRSLIMFCLLPTSFFLLAPYTESLFLLLAAGSLLARSHDRCLLAGALAFLAALTRLQGIVLALPLLYAAGRARSERRAAFRIGADRTAGIVAAARPWLAAAMPLAGTLSFLAYTRFFLHGSLITDTYSGQVHQQISAPWTTLAAYWTALAAHHWHIFSYSTGNWVDAMNLSLAIAVLALVLPARRLLGGDLWLYALATWWVTLCIHQSTARYMLTVFPAFIVLARLASARWVMRLALLLGAPVMLFVAGEFALWSFVG